MQNTKCCTVVIMNTLELGRYLIFNSEDIKLKMAYVIYLVLTKIRSRPSFCHVFNSTSTKGQEDSEENCQTIDSSKK